MELIPFNKPSVVGRELQYINDAISIGHLSGNGKYTKKSEEFLENFFKSPTLLASSCTHALEMSAKLLELKPDDEVILPSFTFVSTANAFVLSGARPIFADISLSDMNIDIRSVEKLITKKTKAVCIVHYAGAGAMPDKFSKLCKDYGLKLVEDNAHGFSAKYKSKNLGTFGDISTLSFHETKNIICGEGGALVLNDKKLLPRAQVLRDKGTNRSNFLNGITDKYTWVDEGSSWVMSELQSAYLYGQMEFLEKINERRELIWNRYALELCNWADKNGVAMPEYGKEVKHSSHLFFLRFPQEELRNQFINFMRDIGVITPFHYQALHSSPFAQRFSPVECINSEIAAKTLVRLPIYYSLTDLEQEFIIDNIQNFKLKVA